MNAAGEGSLSDEHSSIPYIPPSAPLNLAAADGYDRESNTILITLDWQAPSSQAVVPSLIIKFIAAQLLAGKRF